MTPTTIVVPCYNEARRLPAPDFIEFAASCRELSVLFVDDGSTDDTLDVLRSLRRKNPAQFRILELPKNGGKAEAVRQGMLAAAALASKYVGYWDADLATSLDEVPRFAEVLDRRRDVKLVAGVRLPLLGHAVKRHWLRRIVAWAFIRCTRLALGLPNRDTQCGAKLFRWSPAVERVFATPFRTDWIFDVELLVRMRLCVADPRRVLFEQPVETWRDVPGSKVRMVDFVRAASELAIIFANYRGKSAAAWQSLPAEEVQILPLPQSSAELPAQRSAA